MSIYNMYTYGSLGNRWICEREEDGDSVKYNMYNV